MVKLIVGNNANSNTVIVPEDSTLRKILSDNNVDFTRGAILLNGSTIQPSDLDKGIGSFGLDPTVAHSLMSIAKTNNA